MQSSTRGDVYRRTTKMRQQHAISSMPLASRRQQAAASMLLACSGPWVEAVSKVQEVDREVQRGLVINLRCGAWLMAQSTGQTQVQVRQTQGQEVGDCSPWRSTAPSSQGQVRPLCMYQPREAYSQPHESGWRRTLDGGRA